MSHVNKPKVSIIIVNYHVPTELFACIQSILASKTKVLYEIIVVDNDEKKTLDKDLKKKFPQITYIANQNKGFGQGNNVGAKRAKGEYLFFLNPDTEIFPHAIEKLLKFFDKNENVGIVAPLLFGKDTKPYQQGTLELTPRRAIFSLSFLHKLFPKNPVAKRYYLDAWNRQSSKEVAVVPGTAFMMKKNIFEQIGGFDEKFFLYFEEFDLCRRVKKLGLQNYIDSDARVFHHWGSSTKKRQDINKIFLHSRFYYFKKNFGTMNALFTETILRISNYMIVLGFIVALGLFLRVAHISDSMSFIGDQGWFYLAARDMVLTGNIPLVGIASSHPWLHQGALWTYLLAFVFVIFGFNPLNGAYMTAILDVCAIILLYKFGSQMFSKRIGLITAALYATSPLVVYTMRMPYHTSPIPLFTILFIFLLYKWLSGKVSYFPLIIGILALLYNLELATFVFSFVVLFALLFGLWKRYPWATQLFQGQVLLLSCLAFIAGMLPMLVYDVMHGFPQTFGFLAWVGYKILLVFGFPAINPTTPVSWNTMFQFAAENYTRLSFAFFPIVALAFFWGSAGFFIAKIKNMIKVRRFTVNIFVISLVTFIPLLGFFAVKTPSGAYLPMLFPSLLLLLALFIDGLFNHRRLKIAGAVILLSILFGNIYFLISQQYTFYPDKDSFAKRMAVAKYIVTEAGGKEYNLEGTGKGSEFASFTMNYEYLTWWLGNGPSHSDQPLRFVVSETPTEIIVTKAL